MQLGSLEYWYHSKKPLLFELLSFSQRCGVLKAIGFLFSNMPMSLKKWQMLIKSQQGEKRQLPGAIAEILFFSADYKPKMIEDC